jgi:hypothetical protein
MRCVIVNGAKLKAEATCAYCSNRIGASYVREMGYRRIYCDFHCYSAAVETSVTALSYRAPRLGAWKRSS